MSKRSEEKEKLTRLLDEGKISPALYDERMARMGVRGGAEKHRRKGLEALMDKLLARGEITREAHAAKVSSIRATGIVPRDSDEWQPGDR